MTDRGGGGGGGGVHGQSTLFPRDRADILKLLGGLVTVRVDHSGLDQSCSEHCPCNLGS